MKEAQRLLVLDVMLDTVEACALLYDSQDDEQKAKMTAEILTLLVTMTNEMKDVLILTFLTHLTGLLLSLGDLRGETRDEVIAHWRMSAMHLEHRSAQRIVDDADPL